MICIISYIVGAYIAIKCKQLFIVSLYINNLRTWCVLDTIFKVVIEWKLVRKLYTQCTIWCPYRLMSCYYSLIWFTLFCHVNIYIYIYIYSSQAVCSSSEQRALTFDDTAGISIAIHNLNRHLWIPYPCP